MNALPTADQRIFQTDWEVVSGKGMDVIKKKQFFSCAIVEGGAAGDCYGVEVFKRWSQDPRPAVTDALERMKNVVDYFETHHTWPSQESNQNTTKGEDPPR